MEELQKSIEDKIFKSFDIKVPVTIRNYKQMTVLYENNPFLINSKKDTEKLHVTFLSKIPEEDDIKKISGISLSPEEFIIVSDYVYLFCPDGYGNTKLNNKFFEKHLKVLTTTRNWNTVNKLLLMAQKLL